MASINGGVKLKSHLEQLKKKIESAKELRVGFLENATYPDGTPVAYIAAIQEFGDPSRKIPPRPFFRQMIAVKKPGWGVAMAGAMKAFDNDASKSFEFMGDDIAADLRQSVADFQSPALSPITVMLRGMRSQGETITGASVGVAAKRVEDGATNYGASDKPLVDTKILIGSIDFDIDKDDSA